MDEIIVLSTAGSQDVAHRIATALVESGDAACVNIVPGVRSVYRWQGKVCDELEWLLIVKTVKSKFEAVRLRIRALHDYELPEIVSVQIDGGDPDYLRWLNRSSGFLTP
jgi:periplasmic divalent cation tolerance protein